MLDLLKSGSINRKVQEMINDLYQDILKASMSMQKKNDKCKSVAKYIGRYLARPAIAEYRIEVMMEKWFTIGMRITKQVKRIE